ncbi:MAG: iron ABC transporter permease [Clostridiales bacterium]|jgi:iron complex transport system permease protein|nr:iron ABC transporter permease [Clostridiales bacterium]
MSMSKTLKRKITKTTLIYVACAGLTLFLIVVSIGAGYKKASLGQVITGLFSGGDYVVETLVRVNLPRTLVALFSGAVLAVAGVLFQSVTRNRLADPSIVGVSSSTYTAGLFVSLLFPALVPFSPILAGVFGMAVFLMIFRLSYSHGVKSNRILAIGAAVNAVFMMIIITIAVMQNLSATNVLLSLSGSLAVPKPEIVYSTIALSAVGLIAALFCAGKCNVLALGDKTAQGLGVNVLRMKLILAGISVFLTAVAAVNVGITAFLGLLAPLIAKKLLGDNHYNVIPLSALLGGLFLLSADCLGRAMNTPVTLPVGIITTVIGGIVFIILLARSYKNAD